MVNPDPTEYVCSVFGKFNTNICSKVKLKNYPIFSWIFVQKNTPQDIAKDIKNYQSDEISPNLAALVNMGKF